MRKGYKNAYILTMDEEERVYSNGYLLFEENKIIDVGEMTNYDDSKAEVWMDAEGGLLLPGMMNAHTHCGMIPFRSLGDDVADRLRRFLFPLEQTVVDQDLIFASSKFAMAEMLLAGITTFADMYYFESVVAKAAQEMKMRAFVGETIIDMQTPDSENTQQSLQQCEQMIQEWQNEALIWPMVAPHAPNTNQEETLEQCLTLAQQYQVPLMIHVAEMTYEMEYFQEKYHQTPIQFLEAKGFLEHPCLLVHCILLSEEDIDILAKYPQVSVVHCIGANTKSAKGVAPIQKLLQKGIRVCLGTDGPSSGNTLDLFTQMRMLANFHKTHLQDRTAFPAKEIVKLATINGARALGIDSLVGSIEVGKQADFAVIETQSANMFPIFDPYAAIVYSANASNVRDVYVAGNALVVNKQLQEVSLEDLRQTLEIAMRQFSQEAVRRLNEI